MEALRSSLTAYAYNICGSAEEAKDIVQDVFLRFMQMDNESVKNPGAYLKQMVINLAITRKKAMQRQVSSYPGEWLPEPVATEGADTGLNMQEILSYSLMVLLEKLNARQRAVFILKEAFDYEHTEIAGVLGITAEYSRQLLSRAKKQLKDQERNAGSAEASFLSKYLQVIQRGDIQKLEILLTEDISATSDGGGKASAAIKPVYGKAAVSAYVIGIYNKFYSDRRIEKGVINHEPALFYYKDNVLVNCQVFSFEGAHINRIFFIRNPDKLRLIK